MSRAIRALGLLAAGLLVVSASVTAQAQVVYRTQPASKLWIEGTSNKSDWTVDAKEFSGTFTMNREGAPGLTAAKLNVVAAKLSSGRSTIMDRLMYDALKVDDEPQITYELVSVQPSEAGATFTLQTKGRLTLAGTTKEVDMTVQGERMADGRVRFQGQHELLQSDYGITPPSAMFGALRTGDKVTVKFDVVVAPQ